MAYIFYSKTPCYFKINGEYTHNITKNPKILMNIDIGDFLNFIPLNKDFYTIETLLSDGNSLKIFDLFGDKIIVPLFDKKRNLPYKLIYQKNHNFYNNYLLITVIQDGFYKFYLDGAGNYIDELPFKVENVEVKEVQNIIFIIFYGLKKVIFAFDLSTNKLVYKNVVNDFNIEDCFTTTTFYKTLIPVNIIEKWDYNFNHLNRECKLLKTPFDINPKLIGVAFFELISLNASVSFLLSENLKPREKDLLEFIGKPIIVFPYYKDISKTVVVLNDSAHLYSLSFSGGLITNILEE